MFFTVNVVAFLQNQVPLPVQVFHGRGRGRGRERGRRGGGRGVAATEVAA